MVLSRLTKLKPAVVVFDMDGTLLKFKLNVRAAKSEIIELLRRLGVDTNEITLNTSVQEMINMASHQLEGKVSSEEIREKILDIMKKYERDAAEEAEAREDALEVLTEIKRRGYTIAVATNTHREAATRSLQKVGILEKIDALITRDDVANLKPSGDLLRKVAEKFNVEPSTILYIGDSVHDIQAAEKAGVLFIGIEGGIHGRKQLERGSIRPVLRELRDILEILE